METCKGRDEGGGFGGLVSVCVRAFKRAVSIGAG